MADRFPLPCQYSVSTLAALLFGSVSSLGVLDKGALSGVWSDRSMGKTIVLETFSSTLSALVWLISTNDLGMS